MMNTYQYYRIPQVVNELKQAVENFNSFYIKLSKEIPKQQLSDVRVSNQNYTVLKKSS